MAEIVINDSNYLQFVAPQIVNGEPKARGQRPRNYFTHPQGYLACARPFDLDLIPEGERQSRLDARIAAKAQLSDLRNKSGPGGGPIPSTDQDSIGYCWCHSGTSAHLIVRALNNEPYAELSAFSIGCRVKDYQDEGGWGAEGVEFQADKGVATAQFWPQRSMSRSNDTPSMRENSMLHRITEWMDLDPARMKAQLVTCLLLGIPVVSDFNWWSHSVLALDLVSLSPFRIRIWNSWGDSWSENGTGILEGDKAIPDGAVAPRVVTASPI